MKIKGTQYFFLLMITGLIALIVMYGIRGDRIELHGPESQEMAFNQEQKIYLQENDLIRIHVEEPLQYLMKEDGTGFLYEYLNEIFVQAGLEIQLTDMDDADCSLTIVTDDRRDDMDEINYTSPVFQIEGAFFLKTDAEEKERLSGVMMTDRLTQKNMNDIHYRDRKMTFRKAPDAEAVVQKAKEENLDFIIGDRSAILHELDGSTDFLASEAALYSLNVCIAIPEEETALYGILNQCIMKADRHYLTYHLGEKWFNGEGPLYMKDQYEDVYLLLLIIFTAVLIAFFIYYQANKNLYRELNERMDLLTESKQELKTTFNGVAYYLAELDLDGSITDINKAFYRFVNRDTANQKIWNVFDIERRHKDSLEGLVNRAAEGDHVKGIELILNNRTLVLDIFPIENTRGAVEKLLFMGMDVTNERMAERQLLQDNKMIAVGQLAAGVAHEIRNPLGIIRNYCYVLKNMEDEKAKTKAIEQIEKAVENSGAIINSLLDFSRIPTHRSELVDIEAHIHSLTVLNKSILNRKNINLSIICSQPVSAYLPVQSLDMILINLISNATDAMTDNGDLTINVVKYTEQFEIEVRDTGTGISENVLEEIFNPFFTTKGSVGGTGLGLYIVYNEVKKINGEITVESTVGEGSSFKVMLPLNDTMDDKEKRNGEG